MKKFTAEIVSSVFHPVVFFLLMPFLIVYRQTQNSMYALKWEMFSIMFIFVMSILIFFGEKRRWFSDMDITKREERSTYYLILLCLGFIYVCIALYFKGMFFPMSLIATGLWIGVILFDFFNRYIKASNHIAVACAFVLTIGLLYGMMYFFLTVSMVPLIAWSRFILKRHTISEMIAGGVLGSLITLSTFFVGKSL